MCRFRITLAVALIGLIQSHLLIATIIDVPADQPTIQSAISSAFDGDQIVLSPGIYFENIDLQGKELTIQSTDPNDPFIIGSTVIDGNAAGSVITIADNEGPNTQITGLTIRNGRSTTGGGGLFIEGTSPTVANCFILNNVALDTDGGGVLAITGDATFSNCVFQGNSTCRDGGGIFICDGDATIIECEFLDNDASSGGAIHAEERTSNLCIINSLFAKNTGSAVVAFRATTLVDGCRFILNTGPSGGAFVAGDGADVSVSASEFLANTGQNAGGAILVASGAMGTQSISNCRFVGNETLINAGPPTMGGGGAISMNGLSSTPTSITDCVFSLNSAFGVGGAIHAVNLTLGAVSECRFEGNEAGIDGGAISISPNSNVSISNATYCRNSPNQLVGPFFDDGGNQIFQFCPLLQSSAATPLTGACCVGPDLATCIVSSEVNCDAAGGQYGGDGTPCFAGTCGIFLECDLNDDGVINALDIAPFIALLLH